jgi:16S rRNA (guanine966-N2)-methyltransferase
MHNKSSSKQLEFRIIAGTLKGRLVTAPDLGVTRPPLTRMRRAIFDYLMPYLDGAKYLDLFSGTGSYLFEAVSRGAAKGVGVDLETKLAESINKTADKFGVGNRLNCLCADVFVAVPMLARRDEKFDIVMIAPPQYQNLISRTLQVMRESRVTSANCLILCQHDTKETASVDISGYDLVQRREYGNTTYTVLRLPA